MSQSLRLLAISDLHGRSQCLESLDAAIRREHPDLILCAGDLTEQNPSNVSYLESFLSLIKKQHGLEVFAVHGNNDATDIFDLLEATGISLHLQIREFGGYRFSGIGGHGDLSEQVLDEEAARTFNPAGTVFVTHMPPRATSEPTSNLPLIHIAGHTHSTERYDGRAAVPLLRLKSAQLGRGALIELPSLRVHFLDLAPSK